MAITDYIQKTGNGTEYVAGIEYTHPEYDRYALLWEKARDILEGEDELKKKSKREKYLTRLSGHTYTAKGNASYNAFVNYAMLYNATGRTVEAYRGLLNRKLPIITVPVILEDLLSHFTIKDESIYTFIEQVEVELITTNRVGIFIDYPRVDSESMSRAEVTSKNLLPYATIYSAENIINWEESRINNKLVTSTVVLREINYVRTTSFAPQRQVTYRVLELDENGYYRQVIIQPVSTQESLGSIGVIRNVIQDIVYPKKDGKYMTEIPFIPVTAQGITWELSKSVISDLINVNLAHYRDTAFYEKAIAWTASPTAVFSGIPDEEETIALGSSDAIIIPMGGTAKYLEYAGQGIDAIANALTAKEQLMAILGAKILANTISSVESGEAAMIHRAGEQGILADIATTVGGAIEKAIRFIANWRGDTVADHEVQVEITKDYTPTIIDANTIIALSKELDNGHISYESYMWALQRGELLPESRTSEQERALIDKTREGTLISAKAKLAYLDKNQASNILGRDEELIKIEKKEQPSTEDKVEKKEQLSLEDKIEKKEVK